MSAVTIKTFSEYLLSTGFLQQCMKKKPGFIYGPAGYLLRKNIEDLWWERMVTKTEACFPVVGKDNEPGMVYHNFMEFVGHTLPFSIAHISTCDTVSNSVIPEDVVDFIDTSTLTNLQLVHFCFPSALNQTFDQITDTRLRWWKQYTGNSMRVTKAHGESSEEFPCFNLQYKFPWGERTIEKIVNKGDKLSLQIQEQSQQSCMVGDHLPHCIETSMSLDTAMMVYLDDGLVEKAPLDKQSLTRQVLRLHPALAPFKLAVTQNGTKERQLNEVAMYISRMMRTSGIQALISGNASIPIEDQVYRNDRIGVPFTVVVTDETLHTGAIQLRNRDTTIDETLAINKLEGYVTQHLKHQG